MNKTILKWSPAVPIRRPDNIISSHWKPSFNVSYENDPHENMNFLMSNEYMRMWFKERGAYEKDFYTREQIIKEESKIKRRTIQRMMTYRKPTKNQFIEDSIEKTIKKNMVEKDGKEKLKFKPKCPPVNNKTPDQVKVKSKSKTQVPETSSKQPDKSADETSECENDNTCEIIVRACEETS